ncbi:MAG: hypothetical protein M1818_006763 [Claussenomyces sp. TS43310]|nr:MAG: hypothetical protein M1818_006763 [Claussenomyces sp. TS43310]
MSILGEGSAMRLTNGVSWTKEDDGNGARLELCKACNRLDLSVEKFIIHGQPFMPAPQSRTSYNLQSSSRYREGFSPKSRNKKFEVGTLGEIRARSVFCPFCYLVFKSISAPGTVPFKASGEEDKTICFAYWEVDGRVATSRKPPTTEARTRRIHLRWSNNVFKDSYLVFVAPEKYLRLNSDAQHIWETGALFLGRAVIPDANNGVLIKSWLDNCCFNHRVQCAETETSDRQFDEMVGQSYFGVIDVLDMCLVSLPPDVQGSSYSSYTPETSRVSDPYDSAIGDYMSRTERTGTGRYKDYVALSYVWGKGERYTTTLENILVHRRPSGLEKVIDKLPRVIQDAIALVRRLGLRYIWIDSLCIVQDSSRSWKLNANVMNLIYGNALLTICAADGEDANTGLKAMQASEHSHAQFTADCAPRVRLMVSHLAETGIRNSEWNTRAWTFQERLLSKRCLIFTEGRVSFQCRSTSMSEDIVAEPEGAGWSLELVQSPPQMLRELPRRAFWVYTKCVQLYSSRNLSKPKDVLAAFNGVSNIITKTMGAPFVFGLPTSHFDLALLWEPLQSPVRREPKEAKEKEDYGGLEFPSWSWCGWTSATMDYRDSMIEGCLTNVHEWLKEHTWISWYIRDGHGNLRPLWDGERSTAGTACEKRWRGYKAHAPSREREQPVSRRYRLREGEPRIGGRSRRSSGHSREREDLEIIGRRPRESPVDYRPGIYEHFRDPSLMTVRNPPIDQYGRRLPPEVLHNIRDLFEQTLPENPYRVKMVEYDCEPNIEFPDQPLLQFWTWYASFRLLPAETDPSASIGDGLRRYDICDATGDWCGSIALDTSWVNSRLAQKDFSASRYEAIEELDLDFIAISDAKSFTNDECDVWTYYIPKERDQSEWDVYYVLLVERKHKIWRRVALGKVFKTAFTNSTTGRIWKEIILG